jgi:outer membrane receptor for ferrienterochelin and colicins
MRWATHRRATVLLAALAALKPFDPAPSAAQEARAVVTGRVTDDTGKPVGHLELTALAGGKAVGWAVTDAQGRYALSVPPGPVRIVIPAGVGWAAAEGEEVTATPQAARTVDLVVEWIVHDVDEVIVITEGPGGSSSPDKNPGMTRVVHSQQIRETVTTNPIDAIRGQPGVDLVDTGVGGRVVTFRGFNNIFSGSLRYLVDYRKASIPSLRANFTHFVPTAAADMERIELVLGPSAVIYGPNAANGVMNVLTRSPLGLPETTLSISGGTQSVLQTELRTSQRLGDRLGFKVSARRLQGDEFPYDDPVEIAIREEVVKHPEDVEAGLRDIGVPEAEIPIRMGRMGIRNRDIERWSADARLDWAPSDGDTLILQAGRTSTAGIELTPLGAAQAGDWHYDYVQGRLHSGAFFAQAFLDASDAGETFLLRDGASLVDRSRLFGTQIRHGFSIADGREEITYGGDWARTTPKTGGTIHGQFEDDDAITEWGAYLQSRTALAEPIDLVATLRYDESNVIADPVLSPRVGIVFEPEEGHSFNASWARGFSTPTPTNYFLDLSAGSAPEVLGTLGYRVRARGTGRDGIRFHDRQGGFQGMRSPLTPSGLGGPSQLLPISSSILWQYGVGLLEAQGVVDAGTAAYLRSLDPGDGVGINALDPVTGALEPLAAGAVKDVAPLAETRTTTLEVGYRGLLAENLFVQTALWRTRKDNFTSPLLLRTPLLTLDGSGLGAFLVANGIPAAQAEAIAAGLAPVPLAVLSSEDIAGQGAELVATYENYGELTYWGVDLGAELVVTREVRLSGTLSWVSRDHFDVDGRQVPLNAPEMKGTFTVGVDDLPMPVSAELRLRHHSGFPVVSGDYEGTACLGRTGLLVEACVADATLVDVSLGYQGLLTPDLGLRVNVVNVLDSAYRSFVGVPTTGRQIVARLEYRLR